MRIKKYLKINDFKQKIILVIIIGLIISPIFLNVSAEHKEFESKKLQKKVTIPYNEIQAIDFNFEKGEMLEIIFAVQVKGEFAVDIWFVNEDNFLLLNSGVQFLFFVDGSDQQISYARKVLSLVKHDNYKLVITNYYFNQSIEANIIGEIRTYDNFSDELKNNLEFPKNSIYIFIILIIVPIIVIICLFLKIRKDKIKYIEEKELGNNEKQRKNKSKSIKGKNKGTVKGKGIKKNKKDNNSRKFCGQCGNLINTPYCEHCGYKG